MMRTRLRSGEVPRWDHARLGSSTSLAEQQNQTLTAGPRDVTPGIRAIVKMRILLGLAPLPSRQPYRDRM